jgi:hypothetical protein
VPWCRACAGRVRSASRPDRRAGRCRRAGAPGGSSRARGALSWCSRLGEFNLQLALVAARALGEDVEDQFGAVEHRHFDRRVRLRCWTELSGLSKMTVRACRSCDQQLDLFGLAAADRQCGIGPGPAHCDPIDRDRYPPSGRARQISSSEARVGRRAAEGDADDQGASGSEGSGSAFRALLGGSSRHAPERPWRSRACRPSASRCCAARTTYWSNDSIWPCSLMPLTR